MSYTTERKDAIIARLKALGVVRCLVSYSGGGDNGAIDVVEAFLSDSLADGHDVDVLARSLETDEAKIVINVRDRLLDNKTRPFSEEIEALCYDALDHVDVGDWVNNDGGRGELTIDVAAGTILVEHEQYGETAYESTEDDEYDDEGVQGESNHSTHTLT